jgi:hypothetical protein
MTLVRNPNIISLEAGKVINPGKRTLNYSLDFSASNQYDFDLTVLQIKGQFGPLQTVYVDNSANTAPLIMTVQNTNQVITWPANSQGYVTVFASVPTKFSMASIGTVVLNVQLMNFCIQPFVWSNSTGVGKVAAGLVYAGPASGAAAIPTFRKLVLTDLPVAGYALRATLLSDKTNVTGDGTEYRVPCNNTQLALGSTGTYNTSNGIFTNNTDNTLYMFSSAVMITNISSSHTMARVAIRKNGIQEFTSAYDNAFAIETSDGYLTLNCVSPVMDLSANDQIDVVVIVSGGTKTITVHGSSSSPIPTWFSGVYVGRHS